MEKEMITYAINKWEILSLCRKMVRLRKETGVIGIVSSLNFLNVQC